MNSFLLVVFAATGYEHSVANMFYIPHGMFHGAKVSIGQFLMNILAASIGNIIGGGLFIGGSEYLMHHKMPKIEPVIDYDVSSDVTYSAKSNSNPVDLKEIVIPRRDSMENLNRRDSSSILTPRRDSLKNGINRRDSSKENVMTPRRESQKDA